MIKKGVINNKKGQSRAKSVIGIILLVILIGVLIYYFLIVPCQQYKTIQQNVNDPSFMGLSKYYFKSMYFVADKLGFYTGGSDMSQSKCYVLGVAQNVAYEAGFFGGNSNCSIIWISSINKCSYLGNLDPSISQSECTDPIYSNLGCYFLKQNHKDVKSEDCNIQQKGGTGSCFGYYWYKIKIAGKFVQDLLIGFLAGLWIFLIDVILGFFIKFGITKSLNRWLKLMGDNGWKVFAIALGYAVIMRVPIINTFINIITFEVLGINWFILSFIIAFYIGLGPAWLEDYMKFRLRIKAEKAILAAQMRAKLERTALK